MAKKSFCLSYGRYRLPPLRVLVLSGASMYAFVSDFREICWM